MGNCESLCSESKSKNFLELESENITPGLMQSRFQNILNESNNQTKLLFSQNKEIIDKEVENMKNDENIITFAAKLPINFKAEEKTSDKNSKTSLIESEKRFSRKSISKNLSESINKSKDLSEKRHSNSEIQIDNFSSSEPFNLNRVSFVLDRKSFNELFLTFTDIDKIKNSDSKKVKKFVNGDVYFGDWDPKFKKHGKGTFFWKTGAKITCNWIKNKADGYGKYIGSDGSCYEGFWKDNLAEGYGEFFNLEKYQYRGFWQNDQQSGKGEEIWPNGDVYQGDFLNGQKNGFGCMTFHDEIKLEGHFIDNKIHGKGRLFFKECVIEGDWQSGMLNGDFIIKWSKGQIFKGISDIENKKITGKFDSLNNKDCPIINENLKLILNRIHSDIKNHFSLVFSK